MRPHLALAHAYWQQLLRPGDIAIDATCGNGHDTLFLAKLKPGSLYAFDIQPQALETTRQRLTEELENAVHFMQQCHSQFPPEIANESVRLIVYNLGYLPGGNKATTTQTETTLMSLKNALPLIAPNGAISVTCYPGHTEGAREEKSVLEFASKLDKETWNCCYHQWLNREKAPSLLFIEKKD